MQKPDGELKAALALADFWLTQTIEQCNIDPTETTVTVTNPQTGEPVMTTNMAEAIVQIRAALDPKES